MLSQPGLAVAHDRFRNRVGTARMAEFAIASAPPVSADSIDIPEPLPDVR